MDENNSINKFYNDFDDMFSKIIEILDIHPKSKILQHYFYDLFESIFYSNLIGNFFRNLTPENIDEHGLKMEDVEKIKIHFADTIRETENFPPFIKKIDKEYYERFVLDIEKNFPNFKEILQEIGDIINTEKAEKYLESKKELIEESGKKIEKLEEFILINAIEIYVKDKNDFPKLDSPEFLEVLSSIPKDEELLIKGLKRFSEMELKDWDIWHSYSSYFVDELVNSNENLAKIAIRLVKSDLCPLVFGANTAYWYKQDNEVKKSKVNIEILKNQECRYKLPEHPLGYPLELLDQSMKMWHSEYKLFSDKYRNSFPYIRCFLNACYLKTDTGRTIILYPQIKIYANGIFILSFREIAPKETYYLEPFMINEVNISQLDLDNILIPPELVKSNVIGLVYEQPFFYLLWNRNKIRKNNKDIFKRLEENTELIDAGDFKFHLVPMILDKTDAKLHYKI